MKRRTKTKVEKRKTKKPFLWERRHERFGTPAKLMAIAPDASLGRLAAGTGMTVAHLSRIFNGKRSPSFKAAGKIAAYLGVTMDALNTVLARDEKEVQREVIDRMEEQKKEDENEGLTDTGSVGQPI